MHLQTGEFTKLPGNPRETAGLHRSNRNTNLRKKLPWETIICLRTQASSSGWETKWPWE